MESMEQYDRFFSDLQLRLSLEPGRKTVILLQAIQKTDCPYLKKLLRSFLDNSSSHQQKKKPT